jgi:arylformamidase
LLKTRNSAARLMYAETFQEDFAAVTGDGAEWLVKRGIRLVGVDYLPTHNTLLGAGVILLEGCDSTGVPVGDYLLVCAPLKLAGADGAPARAYLMER